MTELLDNHKRTLIQLLRYAVVGVMNTLLTLVIIFVCKSLLGVNPWLANAIGYVAGFINSFLWNKLWVFRSNNAMMGEAVKFCMGFLLCYLLQFAATWLITEQTALGDMEWVIFGFTISGYGVATLLGMVVYTLANFVFNRLVTLK